MGEDSRILYINRSPFNPSWLSFSLFCIDILRGKGACDVTVNISWIKLFWRKNGGVYVTYVANADKDNNMQ